MKKILIDCRWLDKHPRGIGVFNEGLLHGLHSTPLLKEGLRFTILAPISYKRIAKNKYGNIFDYIFTARFPDPIYDFIVIPLLQFIFRFDLIHLTGNTGPIYLLKKTKIILTIHDVSFMKKIHLNKGKSIRQKIGMIYRRILVPKVARYSDVVITVSQFSSNDIRTEIRMEFNPYVIWHGLSFDKLNKIVKNKLNYFVVVSGPDPQKNLIVVLGAFSRLKFLGKDISKLKIVGLTIEEFISINPKFIITSGIEFCGKLTHQETLQIISNAKCTLIPSFYESFGLPAMESLMMCTPVICSSTGALREVAGDAGIYFEPTSQESLVEAIIDFQENNFDEKRLTKWVDDNKKRCSWNYVAKEYLNIYKKFL